VGILDFIKNNLDKILIGVGLLAVLFWPKIKAALSEAQGGTDAPASSGGKQDKDCCCCDEPVEPEYSEGDKSEWVVTTMQTRAYCLDRKLDEGVELCEKLVGVLVAAKPTKKTLVVTREVK
jgi:hypothetical protein